MTPPAWIAADWGTSNLRVWAIGADAAVMAEASSTAGMNKLAPDQFEPALLELIEPWLSNDPLDVVACGMVGARQGWVEAAYTPTPCAPTVALTAVPVRDRRIRVYICAGVSQAVPADVMRGEETQLAGLLAEKRAYQGTVCLPGTHSKWARLEDGKICAFRTFMTGEMYELLAGGSVLRHSVAKKGWDDAAYRQAVTETISAPAELGAQLFSLRAASLLGKQDPATARARLSGLLVGLELAGAKQYWLDQTVAVVGDSPLAQRYADALVAAGTNCSVHDAATLTLAGLGCARRQLDKR